MDRKINRISKGMHTMDGAGVKLVRVFTVADARDIDPFLMMDVFDSTNPSDYMNGFPFHPHRGIETITYIFEGEMEHQDNLGHKGVIGAGDSQWMTAGKGIIHQEMPIESKRLRGAQLWLNLPASDKMTDAKYHSILAKDIVHVKEDGAIVRVIAGDYKDVKGFEGDFVKAGYLDVELEKSREWSFETDKADNLFIYIFDGSLEIGETTVEAESGVIMSHGDTLRVKALDEDARFVVLYGKPLNEHIAAAGPIVMNTQSELHEAFRQLQEGTFIEE